MYYNGLYDVTKRYRSDEIMKIAIGLPAYNEEKNIASIITKLQDEYDL